MNGQQSYHSGTQKVSYRGGRNGPWGYRGDWGYRRHRPAMPGILMFFLILFILSKAWWLIFVIPGLFFWFAGSKSWSRSGSWGCDTPKSVKVKSEKRKNDEFFADGEDEYFDDKPKRQSDRGEGAEYEII